MSESATWLSVGDLELGFGKDPNILPAENSLVGKRYTLFSENGDKTAYHFISDTQLVWSIDHGAQKSETETYRASSLRNNIYFIDFINRQHFGKSQSLVLDLEKGVFTQVTGVLPKKASANQAFAHRISENKELTAVDGLFVRGTIGRPSREESLVLHSTTEELIGKRIQYQYSPTEIYEHIYLNKNRYAWHCIEGVESGLADVDQCHYYKISENLYLFVWREKVIPTLGVIMIDLTRSKTTGKIMGYKNETFEEISNFPVGAHARLLNHTTYQYVTSTAEELSNEK